MQRVLITGGTGLIGGALLKTFLSNKLDVRLLSRSLDASSPIKTFRWDIKKKIVDKNFLDGVDTIIHLSGAGIGDEAWSAKRKEEILNSRVESTNFLAETLSKQSHQVKTFICASATGYYGNTGDQWVAETHSAGNDFLANVCVEWENAARKTQSLGIRTLIFRNGLVLSKDSGALPKLVFPVKYFFGSPLGTGQQFVPWISEHDLGEIYLHAVTSQIPSGAYNAVAPNPVTNAELVKSIGIKLHRPVFFPQVPSMVLKFFLGEMADLVLNGTRASSKKITDTGFVFRDEKIDQALDSIL